jgi:hypothetical protein
VAVAFGAARYERLTVGQLADIETEHGPVSRGTFRQLRAICEALGVTDDLPLTDVHAVDDDLPSTYTEYVPTDGNESDRLVAFFAHQPWCWPPSVTRAQTVRDLQLILDSLGE